MTLHRDSKIFVAGHRGMVGSAIVRILQQEGYNNLVLRSHSELDLTDQAAVRDCLRSEQPDAVIGAAAKVGGIYANNTYPADFIYENLMIECNLIHQSYKCNVTNLLFLGSSCIYPKLADQPMSEHALLSGKLEPTNEPYAIAKIAGIKLCESYNRQYGTDYRSLMPTNLYGAGDNFELQNSHVIPALIRKIHEAKINNSAAVEIWGTGTVKREFLHVDDLARAVLLVIQLSKEKYASVTSAMESHINVGTGEEITIRDLATLIRSVVGYSGDLMFNSSHPDGAPRKLMQNSRLKALGWSPCLTLEKGLQATYDWFLENQQQLRT